MNKGITIYPLRDFFSKKLLNSSRPSRTDRCIRLEKKSNFIKFNQQLVKVCASLEPKTYINIFVFKVALRWY